MKMSNAVLFSLFIVLSFVQAGESIANPGIVPVLRLTSQEMQGGVPEGWKLEKKTGTPSMKTGKDGDVYYLNLVSPGDSSFGVRREVRIDIKKYPILCWRWKINKLPQGGDVRKSATDDQALQIYVAFKESGFLGMNTPVVGYIWDNEAPKGWSGRSPQMGGDKLRYIVVRNKTDNVGQWYTERRNVYKDYKRLFAEINKGEPQGLTTGLQFHINSQHTNSYAESMIGDVYFSSEQADIALAEAGKETLPEKIAKISAVKPPVLTRKQAEKILSVLSECFRVNIEFDSDKAVVGDKYKDSMQKAADYLLQNSDAQLNVIGHADNTGNEEYNILLSKRRAQSVKDYLVEQFDIDPQRLFVQGVGSAQPIADNETPEGRQQNRRVTISDCTEE
jgi:outer membrane protein OmpA-like peptidoglycan-associated protein